MVESKDFIKFSPTTLADVLQRENIMDFSVRPLWEGMPRVAGEAYTVRCAPRDNLMLHAAIHRAPPGAVIVVQASDLEYAVAGGNVCAVAQKRGIAALVIDGLIRDLAEIRAMRFPVFARGVTPLPGGKKVIDVLNNGPIRCCSTRVAPGDVIVADEEGIAIVPFAEKEAIFLAAQRRSAQDAAETLEAWEAAHQQRIDEILNSKGFTG